MSSIRLRFASFGTIVCLAVAAFPLSLSASEPDFLAEEAVFPVVGDLSGVVLQFQAGARGLTFPTFATHAGDDRLFVTLRDGRIKIFVNGGTITKPFLDIRSLVGTEGEGGLLSVAFHPRYAQNGFFFVNYTDKNVDNTIIARYRVKPGSPNEADPASAKVLLKIDQPFANHNGGQIQFGPDGYLYIGMGDGGAANDPQCRAQRDDTLLGKMLRIDVDQNVDTAPFYGIPDDNPYRGNDGVPDEVWARGLRNPWRFSFDRETGALYIADVGQGAREEVNFRPAGSPGGDNFGWKVMEGTLCNSSDACPASTPPCNSAELTPPILEYQNGQNCSVTGGYVYRGSLMPQLRGTYLFGDFCSGQIWGARQGQGGGWEVRKLAQFEARPTNQLISFGEDRRGEIYVLTSSWLWRLAPPRTPDQVGLFDPSTVTFRLKTSQTSGPANISFRFGRPGKGWVPLAGDWDGDGDDTIGYWDRGTKSFRLKNSLAGGGADIRFFLPQVKNSWIPLVGDWNGDGRDTIGFYDPGTAIVRIKNVLASGGFGRAFQVGQPRAGLVPLAGDWDGDGRDSIGIYDPRSVTFRLRNVLGDGTPVDVTYEYRGLANHPPIVGDWDGDGVDTPGFYLDDDGFFDLSSPIGDASHTVFQFGQARGEWVPLVGKW